MANWYDNYTFPFNDSNFDTYMKENLASLGVSENKFFNIILQSQDFSVGGIRYLCYKITSSNPAYDPNQNGIVWFKASVGCLRKDFENYYIKKPLTKTGTATQKARPIIYDTPDFRIKVLNGTITKYIPIYREEFSEIKGVVWKNPTTLTKNSFEPLEPLRNTLADLEVIAYPWGRGYNSNIIKEAVEEETKICKGQYEDYYTTPGSVRIYATFDKAGYINNSYYWAITITEWANLTYQIKEKNTSYNVYAGKEIGNDFLSHFYLTLTKSNTYGSMPEEIVQDSLELNKITPTKYSQNASVSFNYLYNNNRINFADSNKKVINLASGNEKFKNLTYKGEYLIGETLDLNKLDLIHCGSLKYTDGTTIPVSSIDLKSSPRATCSLGSSSTYVIDENTEDFTITYNWSTVYLGDLSYTYNTTITGYTDEYITMVVLENAKTSFNAGEILDVGSNAVIKCYNSKGELKDTITYENFQGVITEYPVKYGEVIDSTFFSDKVFTLKGKFKQTREWSWSFFVNYNESALVVDAYNAKRTYYVNSASEFVIDKTNLKLYVNKHINNDSGSTVVKTEINNDSCVFSYMPFEMDTASKVVPISISYTNEYGQVSTGGYNVNVVAILPESVIVSGSSTQTQYFNNDIDTFKYPTGLTFSVRYTDNTIVKITDTSKLAFFRDENLTKILEIGVSIVKANEGNKIYVKDTQTGTSGFYLIDFVEDGISNVYLNNEVEFTLGNRFNKFRDSFEIKALRQSGRITNVLDYSFKNTNIILSSTDVVIIVNGEEYTLDSQKITFKTPAIESVSLSLNGFNTSYNNQGDGIDCRNIVAYMNYVNAEYVGKYTYDNDSVPDNEHFTISSSNSEMSTFKYDGSTTLNLSMGEESEISFDLTFTCRSVFSSSLVGSTSIKISVIEIIDIIGISIAKTYNDYHVNDTFLNANDDTTIHIFYNDTNGAKKKFTTLLNSGFSAINVFPRKGTLLNNVGIKTIKITAASNVNVACEYSINVNAKYIYDNTVSHDIVAIKQDKYVCSNGKELVDCYILIDRNDSNGTPNTQITTSGERVLATNKTIDDVKVYGYLDDIFDESKNARVILFEDYISPIDGSNNIDVIYPCYIQGNADKINKCKFGILFGNNNAKNRLFVSGNDDEPNCDWHSAMVSVENLKDETMLSGNFGYFEDTSYCYYGETDNRVIGYDIVSNDKLLVLKDNSDKETTVYFRTPVLVSAIDGAGTKMSGIDGETLYQEEFSLVKGNNSVAGISPKSIVNFNGDTLFLSSDNNLVGLDLTGIIGDNQRYANSRSYFIDEDLRTQDLSNAWTWTDNKYLFLCLKDKTYLTHFDTKYTDPNQYEWWLMNVKDIQVVLKVDDTIYFGNSLGQFYRFTNSYDDISKIFVNEGGAILVSEGEKDNRIVVSKEVFSLVNTNNNYKFKLIPSSDRDSEYMYYQIATISNSKQGNVDFYVNTDADALELVCLRNGKPDYEEMNRIIGLLAEDRDFYLNHTETESTIGCASGSPFATYYRRYRLTAIADENSTTTGPLYRIEPVEDTDTPARLSELYRAVLCARLDGEYSIKDKRLSDYSFALVEDDKVINLVRYADASISREFRAEIKLYEPVKAFFITKPYTLGDLNYFKTIWQYTLTNDTGIPSELELTYASNKIPYESTMTLAKISVDKMSFSLESMNFVKVDFDKNLTPRTYTNSRILPQQKFICFGFKNYNNTNSVLSSMSIIYSVPTQSYSGD